MHSPEVQGLIYPIAWWSGVSETTSQASGFEQVLFYVLYKLTKKMLIFFFLSQQVKKIDYINWGNVLTHCGRVTHVCVSKLTIIGSDNGLLPGRRHAIIWTNTGILLIRTSGTNFSEILSEIHTFSFKKMHLKMLSAKWRQFCLSLNVLSPKCKLTLCMLCQVRMVWPSMNNVMHADVPVIVAIRSSAHVVSIHLFSFQFTNHITSL